MISLLHLGLVDYATAVELQRSLVELRKEASGLIQTHQVCDFRVLEDSRMVKMVFPEKFVAALAKHSYPVIIEKDAQGWRYRADLGTEQIGYHTRDDPAEPARLAVERLRRQAP